MTTAKPLEALKVINAYEIEGNRIFETNCLDFDAFKALPKAASLDGTVYALTGWNSDTCRACYKTGFKVAFPLDR